jgi:hypothetical protein
MVGQLGEAYLNILIAVHLLHERRDLGLNRSRARAVRHGSQNYQKEESEENRPKIF